MYYLGVVFNLASALLHPIDRRQIQTWSRRKRSGRFPL